MNIEIIESLYAIIDNAALSENTLSKQDITTLTSAINHSVFSHSEKTKLALNLFYMACPGSCKIIELNDFIPDSGVAVVEAIKALKSDDLTIGKIAGEPESDWEALQDYADEMEGESVSISAEIAGKNVNFNYSFDLAQDPLEVTTAIITQFRQQDISPLDDIYYTRTTENIWDEDGAALICKVDPKIQDQLNKLLSL